MNNSTIHEFTIKLRGDNVYDLYVNDVLVASRGHYENILDELRNAMKNAEISNMKDMEMKAMEEYFNKLSGCYQHGNVYEITEDGKLGKKIGSCSMLKVH